MFVSILMVRILLDECRGRGLSAEQLLAGTGLSEAQLADARQRVPAGDFERLAQRALQLTCDPGLGLALGAQLPAHALQVVGYLLVSAPTMRQAYADFQRFAVVLAETPSWAMHELDQEAELEFECPIPEPSTRRMANDWSLSLAYRMIRTFAPPGQQREHMSVALGHSAPSDLEAYQTLFGRRVRFGQRRNKVTFPRAWLDLPQVHGDAVTCDGLREMAERLLSGLDGERRLCDQLRLMLRRETELSRVDVAALARSVGLSQSALRRKLAAEGVSPSQLVDEARCRVACVELSRLDRTVKQLADALGYAEPSSFHRAFKRWTGKTPADYRASVV